MDTNCVTLCGRLVADAQSMKGVEGVNFRIASNGWKDDVIYVGVSYFSKSAGSISRFLTKGKQVIVIGRLTNNEYSKDGIVNKCFSINCSSVQLLGSADQAGATGDASGTQAVPADAFSKGPKPFNDDEIPF